MVDIKWPAIIGSALVLLTFFPAVPVAADSCNVSGEGEGTCHFSCQWEDTLAGVNAQIDNWFLLWRDISGEARCGSQTAAYCTGQGTCQDDGVGPVGGGACFIKTGNGVDFSGSCTAAHWDSSGGEAIEVLDRIVEIVYTTTQGANAQACGPTTCWSVPVACAFTNTQTACGVGVSASWLRTNIL